MLFNKKTLTWKSYTTNKAFFTTEQVQIINKTNIAIVALDVDSKTFVMYLVIWE